MPNIKLPDGRIISVPDGVTEEQLNQFISSINYTPLNDNSEIDTETGAGYKERFSIGSATRMEDKLNRAKAFYGDSVRQEGDDNISFINPDTGKRTLVNPEGLDFGDVAGVGREIVSTVAGIPSFIGSTAASLNPFLGALASSAAGASAGALTDKLAERIAQNAAEKRGTNFGQGVSAEQMLTDAALETGLGTVGGVVAGKLASPIKKLLNPMNQKIISAYKSLGIPVPTVGTGVGTDGAAKYDNWLAGSPGAITIMGDARKQAARDLQTGVDRTVSNIATGGKNPNVLTPSQLNVPMGQVELGQSTKEGIARGKERFQKASEKKWREWDRLYGDTPAQATNTASEIDRMVGSIGNSGADAKSKRMTSAVSTILDDDIDGSLNVRQLREMVTDLGKQVPTGTTMSPTDSERAVLRGALKDDIADALPPEAAKAKMVNDKWYARKKRNHDIVQDRVLGIDDSKSVEQISNVLTSAGLSTETVKALKDVLSPKDFRTMAAGILENAGKPVASEGLEPGMGSASHIWKYLGGGGNSNGAITPEARKMLFGDITNDLETVAGSQYLPMRQGNHSNTAVYNQINSLTKTPGKIIDKILTLGAPYALAKANTSPSVIKYLAKPQSAMSRGFFKYGAPILGIELGEGSSGLIKKFIDDSKYKNM